MATPEEVEETPRGHMRRSERLDHPDEALASAPRTTVLVLADLPRVRSARS